MPELGNAYVNIIPKAPGIEGQVGNLLNDAAGSAGEKAGKTAGSSIAAGLGKAGAVVGKATMAAFGAAATGVAALTKSAVGSFSDYEQLKGGVETLFGAGGQSLKEFAASTGQTRSEALADYNALMSAQNTVMSNAANAYQTAGMSANQYMETVTSFSASLIQSLGGDTKAAAAYADKAITDMSDNANKMGTDISAIQNAYQGFAKQNYTMLDNLKLGYGGTKTEMERLITDAEKLDGSFKAARDENGNLALSYSDVVDAIHIVQDSMGITGTTAKEAGSTIQGSLASMKAAWQNVMTGMADDSQPFDQLINNLVTSVMTFASNVVPRIQTALQGVGQLVAGLAPILVAQLPGLIEAVLPGLITAATSLVTALIAALPPIVQMLVEQIPVLLSTLAPAILTMLPQILEAGTQILLELINGIAQAMPELIPQTVEIVLQIVNGLIQNMPQLVQAALDLMLGLAQGLINAIPVIIPMIPQIIASIVTAIVQAVPQIVQAGMDLMAGLADGIVQSVASILETARGVVSQIVGGIKGFFGIASPSKLFRDDIGLQLMAGMAMGIERNADMVEDAMADVNALTASSMALDVNATTGGSLAAGGYGAAGQMGVHEAVFNVDGREFARAIFRDLQAIADEHGMSLIVT